MSIWTTIDGRLKVKDIALAKDLAARSIPQPLKELPEVKLVPNLYFKGSEGGARFYFWEPDILEIEASLRDSNTIEPVLAAFLNLVRDVKGQGFIDVEIDGDRWIFENYVIKNLETGDIEQETLKQTFTFSPYKTFKLKTEDGF